jgi:hydroxymethylglutaryl-CoA reductase (NADPH)
MRHDILKHLEQALQSKSNKLKIKSVTPCPSITNLNERSIGEEFLKQKYAEMSLDNLIGMHPVTIDFEKPTNDKDMQLVIKGKTAKDFTRNVYPDTLKHYNIQLSFPIEESFIHKQFDTLYLGEIAFYQLQAKHPNLKKLTPELYGYYWDQQKKESYIFIEAICNLHYANEYFNADHWDDALFTATFKGITQIHSIFFDRWKHLTNITGPFLLDDWLKSKELWIKMAEAMHQANPDVLNAERYQQHLRIIEDLPNWQAFLDEQPKTVTHGDFNPRNIGFRKEGSEFTLCALDWECTSIHLPQFDLAQFLLYSCSPKTIGERTNKYVELARQLLQQHSGIKISKSDWVLGLKYCIYDHIINRLPLLTLIFNRFPPPTGNFGAMCYNNAFELLANY